MLNQVLDFIYNNLNLVHLSVLLSGFILLILWESTNPKREKIQLKSKRWLSNFSLLLCNTIIFRILISTTTISIALIAEQEKIGLAYHYELPFFMLVFICYLLFDFASYLQHTLFHALPILWRIHRVHHSDIDYDVTTGLRFHPLEALLSSLLIALIIISFGAPVLSIVLFEITRHLMLLFSHSNISINSTIERVLRWFIVTPDMHRIHHSVQENETNSNFSLNFSIWDRVFSTYKATPDNGYLNMSFGLNKFRDAQWQTFQSLMLMPFRQHTNDYTINNLNNQKSDELHYISELVDKQSDIFNEARKTVDKKDTELKDTLLRLEENEDYQQALTKNMIDGIITIDESGFIISFNSAAEHFFGYNENEATGKNITLLIPEEDITQLIMQLKEDLSSNTLDIKRDIKGCHKNSFFFLIDIALSKTTKNGHPIYMIVVRDISERLNTQQQIDSQKEQLENILENTSDVYLTLDKEWIITYVNPVSESLLGIKPDEAIGQDLRVILPDVISMFYKILNKTFKQHKSQQTIALYGPTMKHFDAHAYPTAEGVILNLRDITARKNSEEKLRKTIESETINKEKLKYAVELTSYMSAIDEHAIVSITDAAGIILQVNNKFCEVSGYSREELLGYDHRIINSGKHSKSFFTDLWSTISSGQKWHSEVCNKAKDGSFYWVDSAIVPITNQSGEIERYISVRIDITERKQQEAEINKALSELSVANKQLEEISLTDGLTKIANRRCFDEALNIEISKLSRSEVPITLIICDIDYFKNYNDTYGHQAGDICLQKVAKCISSSFTRAGDLVARYGGEEFAIILSNTNKETALFLAERTRKNLVNLQLEHRASSISEFVTISIGITSIIPDKDTTPGLLIKRADKALYQAKDSGRNNVQYSD